MEIEGTFLKGTAGDYNTPPEPDHFSVDKITKIDDELGNQDITSIMNHYERMDISGLCLIQIER